MDTKDLIADFLAKGGKINKLPRKGVRKDSLIPEKIKQRDMLADLQARAADLKKEEK